MKLGLICFGVEVILKGIGTGLFCVESNDFLSVYLMLVSAFGVFT